MRRLIVILVALVLVSVPVVGEAAPEQRVALVIGNSAYKNAPLRNPANDATDISHALRRLGFQVTVLRNANQRKMKTSIRKFGKQLSKGGVGLFYYAGHGMQVEGRNYLIPVGANIETESEAKYEAVDAGRVLGQMEDAGNNLNIIILDACRNNPFTRSFRSADKGLAKMDAPTGSILAYATSPGNVAADGGGRNGLYTEKLLRHMQTPGMDLPHLFMHVRKEVVAATNRQQVPWESSSLIGDFSFVPGRGIEVARKQPEKMKTVPVAMVPKQSGPNPANRDRIRNSIGQEFVYTKPGTFMMGSPPDEPGRNLDERQHQVTLTKGFFIQTTEVTQGQWRKVMGNNPSSFKSCGEDCPVERISWRGALAFIMKLNRKEGTNRYRLPTEAEFEYAARAGNTTSFFCGDSGDCIYEYGWYNSNSGTKSHPVGQKLANAWDLYDMHGNVWEWCQDWYKKNYPPGSVTDPTGPSTGWKRVARGGSWYYSIRGLRSAFRNGFEPDKDPNDGGFRLVLTPIDSETKIIARERNFELLSSGIVYDRKTGLEWYVGPDRNMDWNEAKMRIENLDVGGGGWRFPTVNELRSLYIKGASDQNMTPLLQTSGYLVWSGKKKAPNAAWNFAFSLGEANWNFSNRTGGCRGFAVRTRK